MADPRETLRDARARMKPLVARMMVRRDAAQAELESRQAQRATLAWEVEALHTAGSVELADGRRALLAELDARIAQATEEHAQAAQDVQAALADMAQLEADEDGAEWPTLRGAVDAATRAPGDLLSQDPADIALRHVREHASELEARVGLDRELAGLGRGGAGDPSGALDRNRTSAAAEPDAETKARAELAALKEARKKRTL